MKKRGKSTSKKTAAKKKHSKRLKVTVTRTAVDIDPEEEKKLAETARKNNKNPIMDFGWAQDIKYAGKPYPLLSISTHTSLSAFRNRITVEADPNDTIELENNNNTRKTIHAHADIWKYTLDKYIFQYYLLKDLQAVREKRQHWEQIEFPEKVSEKILAHKSAVENGNGRNLGINEYYLQIPKNKCITLKGAAFETPSVGKAFYLNSYLRGLYLSHNAGEDKFNSLPFDGLKFQLKHPSDESFEIPPFALEDYYLHEMNSCISLAIEIASVIIESKEKIPDNSLWEKVCNEFTHTALPTIVSSGLFFTRNTVARAFFQQILLDLTVSPFLWKEKWDASDQSSQCWGQLIRHAKSHINTIRPNNTSILYTVQQRKKRGGNNVENDNAPKMIVMKHQSHLPDIPDNEIGRLLDHLKSLLSVVNSPVNIPAYIEEPAYGLAMFCNPKHKNIDIFLNTLSAGITNYPSYSKASDALKVFYDVRKAIRNVQDFIHDYENSTYKKVYYINNIPHAFWEACQEAYKGNGGIVFLERTHGQTFIEEQNEKNDAEKIINKILSLQLREIKGKIKLISRENINIWEYEEKEIISVKISKLLK